MNGQDNLIPFNERTEEERREIAKRAGKASGKARREKKLLKEALVQAMNMKDATGKKNSVQMAMALVSKVINGEASLGELTFIRDTVDGKPEETLNVRSNKLEDFFSDE